MFELFYDLTVNSDEHLTISNGSMTGGLSGPWDNYYSLNVHGVAVFGPSFPTDSIQMTDNWNISVSGELVCGDFDVNAVINTVNSFGINPLGTLRVVESSTLSSEAWIRNNGLIELHNGSSMSLSGAEPILYGDGTVLMHANTYLGGIIQDQTIELGSESELAILPSMNLDVQFPEDSSCELILRDFFGFSELAESSLSLASVPSSTNSAPSIDVGSGFSSPFIDCEFRLDSSTGSIDNSAQLLFQMDNRSPDWTQLYTQNILVAPKSDLQREFHMRWGNEGIYLLTTPLNWCPADLNFDGVLDFFDVSIFITAYTNELVWANLQEDGQIDFFDVSAFLQLFQNGCN